MDITMPRSSAPPASVRYCVATEPDGTACERVLEGEDARMWHGLTHLCRESPPFFHVLCSLVQEGMKHLDELIVCWGFQTKVLVEDPEVEAGKPRYKLHWVARHFVLASYN